MTTLVQRNASRVRRAAQLLWEFASSNFAYEHEGEEEAYVAIENIRKRYLFQLLRVLSFTDYKVSLGMGVGDIDKYVGSRAGFSISEAWNYRSRLWRPVSKDRSVFLSDRKSELSNSSGWKKRVHINYDCFNQEDPGFSIPFGIHPAQVLAGRDKELDRYRAQESTVTLLFAGACQPAEYATEEITNLFGKVPRNELYEMLGALLKDGDYTTTRDPEHLLNTEEKIDVALFVLADEEDGRVAQEKWFRVLAAADFFVAGPGVYMPMSHNAIESLAVGTVPIIEYPELFVPNLAETEACVPFSGRREFAKKVRSCLAMGPAAYNSLKNTATKYYDTRLSPKTVGPNLQREILDGPPSAPDKVEEITVIAGHESVNALRSKATEYAENK